MIILILLIFTTGMIMGPAAASHTFKVGKYKATVSDNQYKKLKTAKKTGGFEQVTVKTNKYKTVKKPKYKTVSKKKWVYKNVVETEEWWSSDWSDYTVHEYNAYGKYTKKGWTWYGSLSKKYNGGHHTKFFYKFKKKCTVKSKVMTGFKKVKVPVKMTVYSDGDVDIWYGNSDNVVDTGHVRI